MLTTALRQTMESNLFNVACFVGCLLVWLLFGWLILGHAKSSVVMICQSQFNIYALQLYMIQKSIFTIIKKLINTTHLKQTYFTNRTLKDTNSPDHIIFESNVNEVANPHSTELQNWNLTTVHNSISKLVHFFLQDDRVYNNSLRDTGSFF